MLAGRAAEWYAGPYSAGDMAYWVASERERLHQRDVVEKVVKTGLGAARSLPPPPGTTTTAVPHDCDETVR